jgi:REP element-mobilizing transposase RayT
MVYLNLLRQNIELHGVVLIGYCLMSNHVHLVVIPHNGCGLALALKDTHGRYAVYWNTIHRSSGHAWQGRYFSCPLDGAHLWEALRYAELNPVRAGLANRGGSVEVVQRSGPLRNRDRERKLRFGGMAESLDCQRLAAVSCGRRDGIQAGGDSSMHAHGPAIG